MPGASLFAALLLASGVAAAQTDVHEWLDRMAMAVDRMSYRGTLVFWHDGRLEALSMIHTSGEEGVRERVLTLNGVPREVVRDNDSVICIMPDDRAVLVDRRLTERIFPVIPAERAARSGRYDFALAGGDRVAGLSTQVVDIKPLDDYRYGYRLWLEKTTGMLLKSQLLDRDGHLIEQLMFTDIEIGAGITDEDLRPSLTANDYRRIEVPPPSEPAAGANDELNRNWVSRFSVPEGFRLSAYDRRAGGREEASEHLVFSDGLASVSVYVEPDRSESRDGIIGASTMGALSAYGARRAGHRVTVVGEVPAVTVKRIADSLQETRAP